MFKLWYQICSSSFKNQILAAIVVNLITFSHGMALGWLSPALPILQSDDSPLDSGKVTLEQASWIGSLICIGGIMGNTLFGSITDKIGRKLTLILVGVPNMCFWIMIMFGTHVNHLFIARLLAGGTGGGIFVSIPLFIAEIADSRIRGALGSMMLLFLNCGVLGGFVVGSHLSYDIVPFATIWIPFLYILILLYFPDTPQYWLKRKEETHAEKSLKFYKNFLGNTKEECIEFNNYFNNMRKSIYANDSHGSQHNNGTTVFQEFCTLQTMKAMMIGVVLMGINIFSGQFVITNYSSQIFAESGSEIDPNVNTIIIGVLQLIGTCLAIILVDRFGRRPLLLLSCIGISIGMMTLGTFSYLKEHMDLSSMNWIPTFSLSFVIFIASIGVIPLTVVILAEILPSKVRALGSTVCMISLSIIAFTLLKTFPWLLVNIKLYGVAWLCGCITIVGIIFVAIFVPETKGKVLDTTPEDTSLSKTANGVESTHM